MIEFDLLIITAVTVHDLIVIIEYNWKIRFFKKISTD